MLIRSRYTVLVLWMLAVAGSGTTAQGGTVEGVVRDSSRNPIEAANVVLAPREGGEYRETRAISDAQGHFIFQEVSRGDYLIYARKEEAGFPDVSFAFFSVGQPRPQEIKVDGGVISVVVEVGEPDGKLDCIVEDESGQAVPGAQYRLMSSEDPGILIISGGDRQGRIETLVPGIPVILQMEAAGFQVWRSEKILIKSGQIKHLTIRLTRLTRPT